MITVSNSTIFMIGLVVSVPTIIMVAVLVYATREDAKESQRLRGESVTTLPT